jgi:outer membrane lipoprotein-sorting protein/thiol-disulfide isomerase/thioredoxin
MLAIGVAGLIFASSCQKGGQGAQIYTSFVDKLQAANAVSGHLRCTETNPHGSMTYTDIFTYKKPNLWRVEAWQDKRLTDLSVSDGANEWTYDAIQNRLEKVQNPEGFISQDEFMLRPFLHPERKSNEGTLFGQPVTLVSFHGRQALKVELRVDGKAAGPLARHSDVYMDPKTGFPIGEIIHAPKTKTTYEADFDDFKIEPQVDAALFHYDPTTAVDKTGVTGNMLLPLGSSAPMFKGILLGEKPFDLAKELKGAKALVLNFWGVGCTPCKAELVALQELQKTYASQGLKVVTVDLFDDEGGVAYVVKERKLTLPVVFSMSCKPDIVYSYKATVEPITYLIDSNGKIAGHYATDNLDELKVDLKRCGF